MNYYSYDSMGFRECKTYIIKTRLLCVCLFVRIVLRCLRDYIETAFVIEIETSFQLLLCVNKYTDSEFRFLNL